MVHVIGYLFLLIISLIIRLIPVLKANADYDTYGHLYCAKEVKVQKIKPWGKIRTKVWGSGYWSHPFLWHWVIGLFPINGIVNAQKWINGVLDSFFSVVIYLLIIKLGYDWEIATVGMLLYLLTPMMFSRLAIGPRVVSFTPRLISEITVNLFFVITLLDFGITEWQVFFLGTLFSSVTILSSKFGLQALIFLSPLVSLFTLSINPIINMLSGLVFVLVLTKGSFVKVLEEQFAHLSQYYTSNKANVTFISKRNDFRKLLYNQDGSKLDNQSIFHRIVSHNSYTGVLIKMPIFLLTLYLIGFGFYKDFLNLNNPFIGPVLSAFLVFLIVNRPLLLFLGEAERYLNHVIIFIILSAINLATESRLLWVLWYFVLYGALFWIIEVLIFHFKSPKIEREKADCTIEKYLTSNSTNRTILCYPYQSVGIFRIMLNTPHMVIFPPLLENSIKNIFTQKYETDYPYINLYKIDELAQESTLNTLIVDKKTLKARGLENWEPSDKWRKIVLNQNMYHVYER